MSNLKRCQISIIALLMIVCYSGAIFAEEDTAVLSATIGTVEICPAGTDTWEEVEEGIVLSAGDKIKTGADGMASILFTNGSEVTLKQNTEFGIESLVISSDKKDVNYTLALNLGKLRAIVGELSDNSSFEIKSPTAVAAVRGTTFYLNVSEVTADELPPGVEERLKTELFVEVGGVIYTNTLSGKYYAVSAGETSSSYGDGSVTVPLEIPEDLLQEWLQGWDDILAAEPYQDPDGGDPDLGGTGGGGGDDGTGGDRQSDQLGQLLKEIHEQDELNIIWREMCDKLLALPEESEGDRIFLRNAIRDILADNRERRDEDYLEKILDAQMGKTFRDIYGERVRVEQYVLRPAPHVVELLNVNLRGGVVGGDLTTMAWTTTFNQSLDNLPTGQLKTLPWNSYLDTHSFLGIFSYISSPSQPDNIYPEAMSVKFTHKNDLCDDAFSESRKFSNRTGRFIKKQWIYDQELWVKNFNANNSMSYFPSILGYQIPGTYSISSGKRNAEIGEEDNNPRGFQYRFKSNSGSFMTMKAAFYVMSNDNDSVRQNYSSLRINDVWDALRVNMIGSNKQIGDNNLEMVFSSAVFGGQPIDLIYVPMLSMGWQDDDYIPFPEEGNGGPPFLREFVD